MPRPAPSRTAYVRHLTVSAPFAPLPYRQGVPCRSTIPGLRPELATAPRPPPHLTCFASVLSTPNSLPRPLLSCVSVHIYSTPTKPPALRGRLTRPWPPRPSVRAALLASPRLASPHRTAPHRTGPHRTAPHRTAPHRTSPHLTASLQGGPGLYGGPQAAGHRCGRVAGSAGGQRGDRSGGQDQGACDRACGRVSGGVGL